MAYGIFTSYRSSVMKSECCYLAYCYYYATGEGVTVILAIAGSAYRAERLFKERADQFFHRGMAVIPLEDSEDPEARYALSLIPDPVLTHLKKNPTGTTEYCSELHYNLA
ncbi:hypothetical protein [Dokdonella soli]|uniref:Uncharacterized protein n=1 Tax=Dokdonella soli TaxID=529810 RepID=A0ABN1IRI3_9GAMM